MSQHSRNEFLASNCVPHKTCGPITAYWSPRCGKYLAVHVVFGLFCSPAPLLVPVANGPVTAYHQIDRNNNLTTQDGDPNDNFGHCTKRRNSPTCAQGDQGTNRSYRSGCSP